MTTIYDNKPLDRLEKRYSGSVYTGVATSSIAVTDAHHSIYEMEYREGDSRPQFVEATKGWEARQKHVRQMLASPHDWLLLLDGDMEYEAATLERLRSHGLACVSGHYLRRVWSPLVPIWYEDDPQFRWPMMPFRESPELGRLYRLGATGSGCWLIHREVLEAVEPLLKGEPFFADDPLTWWPYDIEAVAAGREKLRVLRGRKDRIGSDVRLGFFIRTAGYAIWGDPMVQCGHFVNYPVGLKNWMEMPKAERDGYALGYEFDLEKLRDEHMANIEHLKTLSEQEAAHVAA